MKKMLAMLILGATIVLPAAAFAGGEEGGKGPDRSTSQAPAVYQQTESGNPGTVAGPEQYRNPFQFNDHDRN